MNKILIAGADGNIGSYLLNVLSNNYSVKALVRNLKDQQNNRYAINLLCQEDVFLFANNYEGCDILIFLVGLAHKKGRGKELKEFRALNKQTLVNILSAFDKYNKLPKKIIFSSTISIYGQKLGEYSFSENDVPRPLSPYAITKLEAEKYLLDNYKDKSFILRLAPVYSNNFYLNIKRRINFFNINYKVGKGLNKISMCNVENIALVVKGIINEQVPNDIYNISDAIIYSYKDLQSWSKASFFVTIPELFIKIIYVFGCLIKNIFLMENMVKLISTNLFPSEKIQKYVDLSANLNDCEYL